MKHAKRVSSCSSWTYQAPSGRDLRRDLLSDDAVAYAPCVMKRALSRVGSSVASGVAKWTHISETVDKPTYAIEPKRIKDRVSICYVVNACNRAALDAAVRDVALALNKDHAGNYMLVNMTPFTYGHLFTDGVPIEPLTELQVSSWLHGFKLARVDLNAYESERGWDFLSLDLHCSRPRAKLTLKWAIWGFVQLGAPP